MRYSYVRPADAPRVWEPPSRPAPAEYRVLLPSGPATPSQTPAAARKLLAALAERPDRRAVATYALAEELSTGAYVHSVAVRIADGAGRLAGVGMWLNGNYSPRGSLWSHGGELVVRPSGEQLLALATRVELEPREPRAAVPAGPCPRCRAVVRWRFPVVDGAPAAVTYKHARDAQPGEGGARERVSCE